MTCPPFPTLQPKGVFLILVSTFIFINNYPGNFAYRKSFFSCYELLAKNIIIIFFAETYLSNVLFASRRILSESRGHLKGCYEFKVPLQKAFLHLQKVVTSQMLGVLNREMFTKNNNNKNSSNFCIFRDKSELSFCKMTCITNNHSRLPCLTTCLSEFPGRQTAWLG